MKLLKWLLGIVLILLILVFILLFTSFGNSLLKPYVENIIKEKSGFDVKFSTFDIGFSSAKIKAIVNTEITANLDANYSLFSRNFDALYNLNVQSLKSFGLNNAKPMDLNGAARGNLSDFNVNGSGFVVGSNLRFVSRLKDFKPFELNLDAKGLKVEEILVLANQKPYAKGVINANADIKAENDKPSGVAKISSNNILTNNDLIQKDYEISLPAGFFANLTSDIKIDDFKAFADTKINSTIAKITAPNTIYDIENQNLKSDFNLFIDNLLKLKPIINQELNGKLEINGDTAINNGKMEFLNANLKGFGGEILANLKDDTLSADIKNLKLNELLNLASIPSIATANINGNAKIDKLSEAKNMHGVANFIVSNGTINAKEFKKFTNLDMADGVSFSANAKTDIKSGVANLSSNLVSSLLNLDKFNATYDLDKKNAKFDFVLNAKDLSKFEQITGQKLAGKVDLSGNGELDDNNLKILNLNGDALGGSISANLNKNNFKASLNNLQIGDIFTLVGQKQLASGKINAQINLDSIDMKNLNGKGFVTIENGLFNQKNMSEFLEKPFPNGIKFKAEFNPTITNSIAYFNSNISSDLANLTKFEGSFDINKNILDAKYGLKIDDFSKLEFATGQRLRGQIEANGVAKFNKALHATINSNFLGGKLDGEIKESNMKLNFTKYKLEELLTFLDYSKFYIGVGNLVANYDISSQKGDFDSEIIEGRLAESWLTNSVKTFLNRDLTEEVFKDGFIKGKIDKNLINFDSFIDSKKVKISVENGKVDTLSDALDIPLSIGVEKTDVGIKITGTSKDPKYNISSEYLENKIKEKVGDELMKLLDKKLKF